MTAATAERSSAQTSQPGGPAWLMSEFGANDEAATAERVTELADGALVSWTDWAALQLHDPTGGPTEALLDEHTRRPDPARAAVLARPHARAVAGTPTAQSFEPVSQTYHLAYTPDPAVSAPTEVSVPLAWHYRGTGYQVAVTGASIISAAGSDMLQLRASGTGPVDVVVTPAAANGTAVGAPQPGTQQPVTQQPVRRTAPQSAARTQPGPAARRPSTSADVVGGTGVALAATGGTDTLPLLALLSLTACAAVSRRRRAR